MYEAFYGLSADPFRLSSDPRFCFPHRSYSRAKAYVQYALHRAEGFVMVTGRPGTGKTTLVNDLLATLPKKEVVAATLVSTQLGAEDLLRMTAYAFGLDSSAPHKSQVLQRLMEFFAQQDRQGLRTLLIIDEAQDLSASALEELRLLTNLQRSGRPLLQIVLLGQESLRELVHNRDMEQVHQRLIAAWHLEPLDPKETIGYVRHRLERAGWQGRPAFEPGVLALVFKFSRGVPRRINLICSRLLLHGFITEQQSLRTEDALTVIRELTQEELASADDEPTDSTVTNATGSPGPVPSDKAFWSEIDQGLYGPEPSDESVEAAPSAAATAPSLTAVHTDELLTAQAEEFYAERPEPTGGAEPYGQPHGSAEQPSLNDSPEDSAPPPHIVPERGWRFEQPEPEGAEPLAARRKAGPSGLRLLAWTTGFVLFWAVVLGALFLSRPGSMDSADHRVGAVIDGVRQWWQGAVAGSLTDAAPVSRPLEVGEERSGHVPTGAANSTASAPAPVPVPEPVTPRAPTPESSTREPATAEPEAEPVAQAPQPAPDTTAGAAPPIEPGRTSGTTAEARLVEAPEVAIAPEPMDLDPVPQTPAAAPPPSVLLKGRLFFGWNSTEIEPTFHGLLDEVAESLQGSADAYAEVIGYSDAVGNPDYNLVLSRQRAQAVANALIRRGVARESLRVEGRGPRAYDADPATPEPGDRIVEITVWPREIRGRTNAND